MFSSSELIEKHFSKGIGEDSALNLMDVDNIVKRTKNRKKREDQQLFTKEVGWSKLLHYLNERVGKTTRRAQVIAIPWEIMERIILISIGAILGANLRYWLGDWIAQRYGTSFPIGTMIINLTGSFLLALFMTLFLERFLIDPRWRIFLAIGFLGSYTTFSSYTYESMTLVLNGQWALGLFNLLGSAGFGAVAMAFGVYVGRLI